jgi:hypothetical protein
MSLLVIVALIMGVILTNIGILISFMRLASTRHMYGNERRNTVMVFFGSLLFLVSCIILMSWKISLWCILLLLSPVVFFYGFFALIHIIDFIDDLFYQYGKKEKVQ